MSGFCSFLQLALTLKSLSVTALLCHGYRPRKNGKSHPTNRRPLHLFVLHPSDRRTWEQQSSGKAGRGSGKPERGEEECLRVWPQVAQKTDTASLEKMFASLGIMDSPYFYKSWEKWSQHQSYLRKGKCFCCGLGLFARNKPLWLAPIKRDLFSMHCHLIHGSCAVTCKPQLGIKGGR